MKGMKQMFAFDHADMEWMPVNTAPFDRDVELAVIDGQGVHTLSFRCVRTIDGWINAMSQKKLYHVRPTHWRKWQPGPGLAA
jgi:hypothetical protein